MEVTYKTLRVWKETWQSITHLCADTGEARTQLIDRLVKQEEARIEAEKQQKGNAE